MNQFERLRSGRLLPVMEEFYSIQGEGFHTGRPAWFIRIGGCDVGCSWCDVKESWNADLFPPVPTDVVVSRALECPAGAVIVTGGEPLLYNLDYLCERLKSPKGTYPKSPNGDLLPTRVIRERVGVGLSDLRTFLETSGSQPLSGTWDWICLSPKVDWPPRTEFYTLAHELKVIVQDESDLKWAEEQAGRMHEKAHLFLQPEWSRSEEMLPVLIRYIKSKPAWTLSLQTHKYIGIP